MIYALICLGVATSAIVFLEVSWRLIWRKKKMKGLDLIGRMNYELLSPEHQAIVRKIAEKTIFTTYTVASMFSYCNYNEENTVEQLYMLWIGGPMLPMEYWEKKNETNL